MSAITIWACPDCDCEDRSLAFRIAARLLRYAGQVPKRGAQRCPKK